MLISPEKRVIPDLFSLWKTCFHDEDDYIRLFFEKEYENCRTFASFENGGIVSVLYLLDCFISLDGERYDGYYFRVDAELSKDLRDFLSSSVRFSVSASFGFVFTILKENEFMR